MQGIKALVFGMGFLLLAGLGVLGYGLLAKAGKLSGGGGSAAAFGTVPLPLPPKAQLLALQEAGGRLAVLVDDGSGRRSILVLDPAGGTVLGSFVPAAP